MNEKPAILPVFVDMPYREQSGASLYTITLLALIEPMRIDKFLTLVLPELTRSRIEKLIDEGQVLTNKTTITKPSFTVKSPPLKIKIFIPAPPPTELVPMEMPLDILYEDEHILALNKPAGLVMHPAAGHSEDTLTNALAFHFKELSTVGGSFRMGVVHRLDKDTSGVLLITKNDKTHLDISSQFKDRLIQKIYIAVTIGRPKDDSGVIDAPIIRHPKHRKRFTSRYKSGREAKTEYQTVASNNGLSVILCRPKTGRTHQIRVHLAEQLNCPILGDQLYGGGNLTKATRQAASASLKELIPTVSRQLLHAYSIEFTPPKTKTRTRIEAPPPEDIKSIVEAIAGRSWKELFRQFLGG